MYDGSLRITLLFYRLLEVYRYVVQGQIVLVYSTSLLVDPQKQIYTEGKSLAIIYNGVPIGDL